MSATQKSIAIITGASSGLGEEFARQLLFNEPSLDEIWLVARRRDRLESLAQQLHQQNSKIKVKVLPIDLTQPQQIEEGLKNLLEKENPHIGWCINNAGFGLVGDFHQLDLNKQLEMIDLNVRAATHIAGLCIPYMKKGPQRGGHLVLTASSAGFFPLPTFAVYAASKAYVVNFANALSSELQHWGIHVTAVCPGPVATEFFAVAYSSDKAPTNQESGLMSQKIMMTTAPEVVRKAIQDSKKGLIRSTQGGLIEFMIALSGFLPRKILLTAASRMLRKKF